MPKKDGAADIAKGLIAAAKKGETDTVRVLLDSENDKVFATHNMNAALRWAARKGHTEIVGMLLEIPKVKHLAAAKNNEALRWAAKNGHTQIVKMLLEIEAVRINATANNNEALTWAAGFNHPDIVKLLLDIEDVKNNAAVDYNFVLIWAVRNGHADIAKILLEIPTVRIDAHVNQNSALLNAIISKLDDIVTSLLDINEVRNRVTVNNNFIFKRAVRQGNKQAIKVLINDCPAILEKFLIHYLTNEEDAREIKLDPVFKLIDNLYQKQILIQSTLPLPIEEMVSPELFGTPDLDQNPDLRNRNIDEKRMMVTSAILHAAHSNHQGVFNFLLSNLRVRKCFTLNLSNELYKNTLVSSVKGGNLNGLKLLLEIKKNRDIFKENYTQLLDDSIKNGNPEMQAFLKNTFEKLKIELPAAIPILPNPPLVTTLYQKRKQDQKCDEKLELSDTGYTNTERRNKPD